MALLHSAFAFLVTVTYVYAAPQMPPAYCLERPIKGGCREINQSWYIDASTKQCVAQRQVLCGGGQGGFQTRQLCMDCQNNSAKKGPSACPPNPFLGGCQPRMHRWFYDSDYKTCRAFQHGECSRGRNHFVTEYQCREMCVPGVLKPPDRCQKPLVRGQCQQLHRFWHYNFNKNDCFKYKPGLCGVGNNMFVTKETCLNACQKPPGKKLPGCLATPRFGNCQSNRLAWFFDYKVGRCRMFRNGDCGTGGNYFASERKCKQECLRIGDPQVVCSAKPISAYCLGYGTHWYFDETKNNCYRFSGGWCGKNANGFKSYSACMNYCSYPEAPSYPPQSKNNVPPVQQQQQVKTTG